MSTNDEALRERYVAAVEKIADSRSDGAVLRLEADWTALDTLRQGGAAQAEIVTMLRQAADLADAHLRPEASATLGWNRRDLALRGSREKLIAMTTELVQALIHHPVTGQISWRAILVRIFPGDALRTHCCDAAYDLAPITAPAVVWVEPYPHDDWKEPQRYPTVSPVWRGP